jgi:hypothetical protein
VRGRIFRSVVTVYHAGVDPDWTVPLSPGALPPDKRLVATMRRLLPRVRYGGKKGWRAFARLWQVGVYPGAPVLRTPRVSWLVTHLAGGLP